MPARYVVLSRSELAATLDQYVMRGSMESEEADAVVLRLAEYCDVSFKRAEELNMLEESLGEFERRSTVSRFLEVRLRVSIKHMVKGIIDQVKPPEKFVHMECVRCAVPVTDDECVVFGEYLVCKNIEGCVARQRAVHGTLGGIC